MKKKMVNFYIYVVSEQKGKIEIPGMTGRYQTNTHWEKR